MRADQHVALKRVCPVVEKGPRELNQLIRVYKRGHSGVSSVSLMLELTRLWPYIIMKEKKTMQTNNLKLEPVARGRVERLV